MAERCALFIIIALGESIVVTGATFSELTWTAENVARLRRRPSSAASRCGGSISTRAPKPAPNRFQDRASRGGWRGWPTPTCICRSWPASSCAAVADELVLKHPGGHSDLKTVLSAIGGPLLFLIGTILFKHTIRGFLQLSHGAGIIALGILAWFAGEMSPLLLSILTTAIMVIGRGMGVDFAEIGTAAEISVRGHQRVNRKHAGRRRSMICAPSSPSPAPAPQTARGCTCSCSRCGWFRRGGTGSCGRACARSAPSG